MLQLPLLRILFAEYMPYRVGDTKLIVSFRNEIADFLYTTQPQYYRYESGQRDLPCELVIMLAKFYNVSVDYITSASNVKHPYPKK